MRSQESKILSNQPTNQPTSNQTTNQPANQPACQPTNQQPTSQSTSNQAINQPAANLPAKQPTSNQQATSQPTNQQPTPAASPENKPASNQTTSQATNQQPEGAGGRGEALRFAAPPKGERGVMDPLMKILQILSLEGPRPCRRPLHLYSIFMVLFRCVFAVTHWYEYDLCLYVCIYYIIS